MPPGFRDKKATVRFKALKIFVLSFLVIVVAVFMFAAWRGWTNPARPEDYEGRIVDRWAENGGGAESYRPRLALVIESNDGRRFSVKVDPTVYESARVGMLIRSKSGQIVLIESPQNPVNK